MRDTAMISSGSTYTFFKMQLFRHTLKSTYTFFNIHDFIMHVVQHTSIGHAQ